MKNWTNPLHEQLVGLGKTSYLNPEVETKFVPAPIGGWDVISPLSMMDPQYGVILDNIVCRPGWLEPRGGASYWCRAISTQSVETLMAYRPETGVEQLFAATGSEIWDVSNLNSAVVARTGMSNSRFQYTNFTPSGGDNYLIMVNGIDSLLAYDGVTFSNPVITGVASSTFVNVLAYKRRLWFVQGQSNIAWYLGVDAIAGAATSFSLGSFFSKGGYLIAIGAWTIDGGNGPDDYIVFLSNKGQAILYKGVDPSSDFELVGVFDLPTPVNSYRCMCKLGSDTLLITLQGLIPLSQALPFNPSGVRSIALTNRIQNAMLTAAQNGFNLFGWQTIPFPLQSLVVMNVPITESFEQHQYVMNPMNGSWSRFKGWNANCFEIYNENLYFGDNSGNVNLSYVGSQDLGEQIECDIKCAFNYLDAPGRIKNMSMIRPFFAVDIPITLELGVDVDFADSSPMSPINVLIPAGASLWDVALWDVALWSESRQIIANWLSANALGTALAIRMKITLGDATPNNISYISSGQGVPTLQINVFECICQFGGPI